MKYWVPRQKPKWLLIDCLILHANVLVFLFETKQEILIRSRVTYSCMVSFHSLCHYWERLFTSEIATSGSIWIPCFWLAVKIRSRQINRFWAGFFFFQMSGCPTTLLTIWWTLPTPTQFACYHFPISYLLWISQDVVHVAPHFFKTYNCFNIIILNKLSIVFLSFCQELITCCFVGLHNGNIWWATCCWNSKEYYFLLKYTCTLLLVFLSRFSFVWLFD